MFRVICLAAVLAGSTAFAQTVIAGGNLPGNATWTTAGSPYNVQGDLTIPAGVTLTIQPGVTVNFSPSSDAQGSGSDTTKVELIVQGTLVADGTAASKITFTTTGASGTWVGIRVLGGTGTSISHANISKAITGVYLNASASVTDTTVSSSSNYNVAVAGGTATLTRLMLLNAGSYYGLYATGGTTNLSRSLVQNSGSYGVYLNAPGTLDHNTIVDNGSYGINLGNATPHTVTNNIITGNGSYGVYRSSSATGTITYTNNDNWGNTSGAIGPYMVTGQNNISANPLFVSTSNFELTSNSPCRNFATDASDLGAYPYVGTATTLVQGSLWTNTIWSGTVNVAGDVTVPTGVTLTINPGTTVNFATSDSMASGSDTARCELIVNGGTLTANGTSTSKITFTTGGASGAWTGIRVLSGNGTAISHATVDKAITGIYLNAMVTVTDTTVSNSSNYNVAVAGGAATLTRLKLLNAGSYYGLYATGGTTNLSRSLVQNSGSYGVYLNAPGTLDHNTIVDNGSYGINLGNATPHTVTNNIITGNGSYGVYRSSSATGTISYTNNDNWGNTSGAIGPYMVSGSNNISANPLYVSTSNFELTSNSPCRNFASDASDIGAFPYVSTATTLVQGTLWTNTTWSGTVNVAGDVTVPTGVTLTVNPGTTVNFATTDSMASGSDTARSELIVSGGTLTANGTSTSKITFTTGGASGSWVGIRVLSGSGSAISHATVDKAITGIYLNTTASVSDTTVSNSSNYNVAVAGGTATLTRLMLLNAGSYYGLYATGGTTNLSRSLVHNNGSYGVYLNAPGTLDHNTIAENGSYGINLGNATPHTVTNNVITGNGSYGVYRSSSATGTISYTNNDNWGNTSGAIGPYMVSGSNNISANPLYVSTSNFELTSNSPCRFFATDGSDIGAYPYVSTPTPTLQGTLWTNTTISGTQNVVGDLTVGAGQTLTLAPGATLNFATSDGMASGADTARAELIVSGQLVAQGSSSSPVNLTTGGASGAWYGVRVIGGTGTVINNTIVDKAVTGVTLAVTASVTNSTIKNSSNYNVAVTGGTATLAYLTLENAGSYYGLYATGGVTNLSWSLVRVNGSYGVYLNAPGTLDHNTIDANGSYGINLGNATPHVVTNNIIVNNGSYGVYRSSSATGSITYTNNDNWNNTSGAIGPYMVTGSANLSANPQFVSATPALPADYKLQASSVCRGAGTQSSDIGAFPYSVGAINSIVVTPTNSSITVGTTVGFVAQAFDASNNPIPGVAFTWTAVSSVGTINSSGQLTASCTPSAGLVTGAVTASASGKSGSTGVTLVKGPVATVQISPSNTSVAAGGPKTFTASAFDACNNPLTPAFTWSAGTGSGTVDQSGNYTAPCALGSFVGAVTVSASSVSASATVNVTTGPLAQVALSPTNPSIPAGGQQQFSANGTDTCGNNVTGASVTWSSTSAGTINSSGLFTAGTSTGTFNNAVTATSGSAAASTNITITGGAVASVTVSPASITLDRLATQTFTITARDSGGNIVPGTATFSLADANAGSIDASSGLFTASNKAGTYNAVIRATVGTTTGTATVIIRPGAAASVAVTPPSVSIAAGGSTTFSAQVLDSTGNVRADTVTWSIANSAAGTITQAGVLTAGATAGTYTDAVVATVGSVTGKATVTISATALSQVIVAPSSSTVRANNSAQFTASGKDGQGNTVPVTVTWSVVNGGGTINASGLFTASTTPGTYVDTVRAQTSSGLAGTATVIVTAGPVVTVVVSPSYPELPRGGTQQFTATAKDAFDNVISGATVVWSASGTAGNITLSGLFTAGATSGDFPGAVTADVDGIAGTASVRVLNADLTDGGSGGGAGGGSGGVDAGTPKDGDVNLESGCGCTSGVQALVPGAILLLLVARRRRKS